jgi:hypothetical protein
MLCIADFWCNYYCRITIMFTCAIHEALHEHHAKKYITIHLDDESRKRVIRIHGTAIKHVKKLVDPLDGSYLKVKVPFRYNRIMCTMTGNKTIHELVKGDIVTVAIEYCGWWERDGYGGPSWKLTSVQV